jgi:putative oxidoreductase
MEIKTIIFWVLLIAFVLPTYYFGYTKLVGKKDKVESFLKWGYSLWFMKLLGAIEILADSFLLFSQTRLLGMIILGAILMGAVFTHIKNRDNKAELMPPIFVAIHLAVIFVFAVWIS